jgi:hypothetical protein
MSSLCRRRADMVSSGMFRIISEKPGEKGAKGEEGVADIVMTDRKGDAGKVY